MSKPLTKRQKEKPLLSRQQHPNHKLKYPGHLNGLRSHSIKIGPCKMKILLFGLNALVGSEPSWPIIVLSYIFMHLSQYINFPILSNFTLHTLAGYTAYSQHYNNVSHSPYFVLYLFHDNFSISFHLFLSLLLFYHLLLSLPLVNKFLSIIYVPYHNVSYSPYFILHVFHDNSPFPLHLFLRLLYFFYSYLSLNFFFSRIVLSPV